MREISSVEKYYSYLSSVTFPRGVGIGCSTIFLPKAKNAEYIIPTAKFAETLQLQNIIFAETLKNQNVK